MFSVGNERYDKATKTWVALESNGRRGSTNKAPPLQWCDQEALQSKHVNLSKLDKVTTGAGTGTAQKGKHNYKPTRRRSIDDYCPPAKQPAAAKRNPAGSRKLTVDHTEPTRSKKPVVKPATIEDYVTEHKPTPRMLVTGSCKKPPVKTARPRTIADYVTEDKPTPRSLPLKPASTSARAQYVTESNSKKHVAKTANPPTIDDYVTEHKPSPRSSALKHEAATSYVVPTGSSVSTGSTGGSIGCCVVFDFDQTLATIEVEPSELKKSTEQLFGGEERVTAVQQLLAHICAQGVACAIVSFNKRHAIKQVLSRAVCWSSLLKVESMALRRLNRSLWNMTRGGISSRKFWFHCSWSLKTFCSSMTIPQMYITLSKLGVTQSG